MSEISIVPCPLLSVTSAIYISTAPERDVEGVIMSQSSEQSVEKGSSVNISCVWMVSIPGEVSVRWKWVFTSNWMTLILTNTWRGLCNKYSNKARLQESMCTGQRRLCSSNESILFPVESCLRAMIYRPFPISKLLNPFEVRVWRNSGFQRSYGRSPISYLKMFRDPPFKFGKLITEKRSAPTPKPTYRLFE